MSSTVTKDAKNKAEFSAHIDVFRNFLAAFLVTAFVSVLILLLLKKVEADNKDIIVYMIGQLSGMATMALGFYYVSKAGQDQADAKKTENTGKMADAMTAVATAASGTGAGAAPPPDVAEAATAVADAAAEKADDITSGKPL